MPIYMEIEKGTGKNKKLKAIFSHYVNDKKKIIKTVQFGDSRYEDYLTHKNKERREAYRKRHQKDLEKGNYMSAGYLSYYLLWGQSAALKTNISNYKKKFNLK